MSSVKERANRFIAWTFLGALTGAILGMVAVGLVMVVDQHGIWTALAIFPGIPLGSILLALAVIGAVTVIVEGSAEEGEV